MPYSAREFIPESKSLEAQRDAARICRGCELYRNATQTVFGEGHPDARIVLVGEQPGDSEDLRGRPFVGPAGRVLDEALRDAGIDRDVAYVTNIVKHFNWTPQGKLRMHRTPGDREVTACLPWLEKEMELIRPQVLVALGATAARALFGAEFRVTRQRGELIPSVWATHALATVHPSSILLQPTEEDRLRERGRFVEDLKLAAGLLTSSPRGSRRL